MNLNPGKLFMKPDKASILVIDGDPNSANL
jgi:hypothetical protein